MLRRIAPGAYQVVKGGRPPKLPTLGPAPTIDEVLDWGQILLNRTPGLRNTQLNYEADPEAPGIKHDEGAQTITLHDPDLVGAILVLMVYRMKYWTDRRNGR